MYSYLKLNSLLWKYTNEFYHSFHHYRYDLINYKLFQEINVEQILFFFNGNSNTVVIIRLNVQICKNSVKISNLFEYLKIVFRSNKYSYLS